MKTQRGAMNDVYLLWHVREVDGADDELLIGVYRAEPLLDVCVASQDLLPFPRDFKSSRTNQIEIIGLIGSW
jgi:hypothetical protein